MMKNILVLCFLCTSLSGAAFCQDEIEIDSQIISVNPDKEYIIIEAGENQGVEIGDGLIVHRNAEKLAEAQIVEVRGNVAAAEILNVEKEQKKELIEQLVEKDKEIKEGDSILIVKKAKNPNAAKTERSYREPKKSKWAPLLGSSAEARSAAPVEIVASSPYAGRQQATDEPFNPDKIQITKESTAVRAYIEKDAGAVFSYATMVLRENGYSVVFSNRMSGVIMATRPIELSIISELWADASASIEHKLVMSLEIKSRGGGSVELTAASFKEHTQKGRQIKLPITIDSSYYNVLVELVAKIKERASR